MSYPDLKNYNRIGVNPDAIIEHLSPASLAYIGDAVYELHVRNHYLVPAKRMADYHQQVITQVCAEAQADCLTKIEPLLDESERNILRRGRNAVSNCPKRLSIKIYQQATSFETLVGYLYLKNPERLNQLLSQLEL